MEIVSDSFSFIVATQIQAVSPFAFGGNLDDGGGAFGLHIEVVRSFDMRNDMQITYSHYKSLSIRLLAQGRAAHS